MKTLFLTLFIFLNIVEANFEKSYNLTKKEQAQKRIYNFEKLKKSLLKEKNLAKKLMSVNSFFNKIKHKKDYLTYKTADYWATRIEFLTNGYGDCEDYVIAKYFTLRELGIKASQLHLTMSKYKGQNHLVLVFQKTKNSKKFILDNVTNKILPEEKRKSLKLLYTVNRIDTKNIKLATFNTRNIINYRWSKVYKNSIN